ncbi:MAG: hypothetical protein ACOX52_14895 [Verrucomicrobiota bacterium]
MAVVYASRQMVFSAEIQELEGLRTANTRTWVPIVEQADGVLGPDPGAGYTELAGGLHWNAAQPGDEPIWLPTRLDWETDPKGGAIIPEAPRTAHLAPQLTDMPMLAIHPQEAETPRSPSRFTGLATGIAQPVRSHGLDTPNRPSCN